MKKIFLPLLLTVAIIAAFVVILAFESDYLMRVEELSLFLYTPHFLSQQLVVAGGMLSYVGAWLTQFLYVPWQGALVICLLCALLTVLMQQAFRLPACWAPLLLAPIVAVLLSEFMTGYWIYLLKMRGWFFAFAVGSCVTLSAVWVYRLLMARQWWLRAAWMVFIGIVLYPLAGIYGLAALLLTIAMEWRSPASPASKQTQAKAATKREQAQVKVILTVLAVLLMIVVPLLCYRYVYDQTPIGRIWWCGLPLFMQGDKAFHIYYLPYLLMLGACLLAVFVPNIRRRWLEAVPGVIIVAALVYVCYHFWYKDENFHKEIQMEDCVEQCNWQGVMDIAATADNPTRQIVLYKYLALFKMNRAGEEMYDLPDGGAMPDCPAVLHLVQLGGQQLYLQYGMQNFCYRWCVEDGVEYGWRVKNLRLMLRCSLLNHEWSLAQKFIDLLRMTRNHASWAEEYQPLVGHPELIAKHRELGPITHGMGTTRVLASDQSLLEKFLLTILAGLQTDEPVGADLALMSAVQTKDIPTFWRAFSQYAATHPDGHMPRIYQEAAFLYGNLEHNVDISKMPFDQSVIDGYQGFMQMGQQYQGMDEAQMRSIFYPKYGKTFYYNYFLVRGLKTY